MVQNLVAFNLRNLKSFKQTRSWNTLARAEVIVDSDSLYTSLLHIFSIYFYYIHYPCLPLVYVKLGLKNPYT